MTDARQRLIQALTDNELCLCGGDACSTPEQVVDALAHQFAEQLRARGDAAMEAADAAGGRTTPSDPKYDKAAAWYAAANLIDPESQR
ncbi:MAG TPA: hypothetical protein VNO54_00620 [Streptosporangiaceae bacterium]|nr:hypothetical protein [Streptosporangiaceae bacterium]